MRRTVISRGALLGLILSGLAACAAGPVPSSAVGAASLPTAQIAGRTVTAIAPSQQGEITRLSPRVAAAPQTRPPTLESAPSGDELAFVTDLLTRMQLQSYATGRETCGYIGRDSANRMVSTAINVGSEASCYLPPIPPGMRLLASVHTHGTYSPAYASEFPTVQDMMTDAQDNIDGYISTPGGRLWYVDTDTMTVRQLCGRGCLPQDPRYRPEDDGPVRPVFTLRDLQIWESY